MAKKKGITWGELSDLIAGMSIEERTSPVLFCTDECGYDGLDSDCVEKVPDDVDLTDYVMPGLIKKRDVKPGKTFIQL